VKGFKAVGAAGASWSYEERIAAHVILRAARDYESGTRSQRLDAARFFAGSWYGVLADGLGVEHGVMPEAVRVGEKSG